MEAIHLTPKSSATLIRQILRAAFPATKFRVTTGRGAGVSSVHIRWTDGPTPARVDELVQPFSCGHFDGMTDSFNYRQGADRFLLIDGRTYVRGARHVFTERDISAALANRCIASIAAYWGGITEPLPVAVEPECGRGYVIADGRGRERIRSDLDHTQDWYSLIHRAANDRTRYHVATAS